MAQINWFTKVVLAILSNICMNFGIQYIKIKLLTSFYKPVDINIHWNH